MTQTMLRCAMTILASCFVTAAVAQDQSPLLIQPSPVVVELFTSQGCVSCPPADEYFASLIKDPNVIGLALHVDYWDYIGWTDQFARPEHTARQKDYARAIGARTIYTPQFIINGDERIEGNDAKAITSAIAAHQKMPSTVEVQAKRDGEHFFIKAVAKAKFDRPVRLDLVRYKKQIKVQIERGENEGKVVDYHNIVSNWQPITQWDGTSPLELKIDAKGSEPAVVIIQQDGPERILAAANVKGEAPSPRPPR